MTDDVADFERLIATGETLLAEYYAESKASDASVADQLDWFGKIGEIHARLMFLNGIVVALKAKTR